MVEVILQQTKILFLHSSELKKSDTMPESLVIFWIFPWLKNTFDLEAWLKINIVLLIIFFNMKGTLIV